MKEDFKINMLDLYLSSNRFTYWAFPRVGQIELTIKSCFSQSPVWIYKFLG
jgi:hypothetical protein